MGLGHDFGNFRQECRGLLRMEGPVALKVGLTFKHSKVCLLDLYTYNTCLTRGYDRGHALYVCCNDPYVINVFASLLGLDLYTYNSYLSRGYDMGHTLYVCCGKTTYGSWAMAVQLAWVWAGLVARLHCRATDRPTAFSYPFLLLPISLHACLPWLSIFLHLPPSSPPFASTCSPIPPPPVTLLGAPSLSALRRARSSSPQLCHA